MKKHKPDPQCLDLWENRARKFQLLRDLYFVKTPAQKLMLCVIELTIGNFRELRIPMKTLAQRCILSEKRGYAVAEELRNEGLIKYIPQRGKAPLFQILWHWVDRLHTGEPIEADEAVEEVAPELVEAAVPVLAGENRILASENSILVHANPVLASKNSILASEKPYIGSSDSSSIESSIRSSTSTSSSSFDELVVMVGDAGVIQDEPTVRKALDRGLTLDQVRDVVAHFNANAGRWDAGVLVNRLTRPGAARLAPDAGWYGDRPQWLAERKRAAEVNAQTLAKEADTMRDERPAKRAERLDRDNRYGPIIDAMTKAERNAFVAELFPDRKDEFTVRVIAKLDNPLTGGYRDAVLERMQQREAAAREAQGRRESMARLFSDEETSVDAAP